METYNSKKNEWLYAERIKLSYSHFFEAFLGPVAAILFICGILWAVVPHLRVVVWFFFDVMIIRFSFFLLWRSYKRNSPVTDRTYWYDRWLTVIFVAGGIIHGSAAIFLFPVPSVPHQAMLAFITGGIVAGVVGIHSINMRLVIGYTIPAVVPFAARFILAGDEIHIIMGVTLLTYIALMLPVARRMHSITLEALSLSYELCRANDSLEGKVCKDTASLRKSLAEERKLRTEKEMMLRDLHDGVGGIVTNINMIAETAHSLADLKQPLSKISHFAKEGMSEIKSFMQSLDETDRTWRSLEAELRDMGSGMTESHNISFDIKTALVNENASIESFLYLNLVRIYKEAMTNVIKHSKATKVDVAFEVDHEKVTLLVNDNGVGLSGNKPKGRGLANMKTRAIELGGEFTISSDAGLSLTFVIPLSERKI